MPKLVTLASPFRLVIHPIVDYVLKVEKENPERTVAVVIASMVERTGITIFCTISAQTY